MVCTIVYLLYTLSLQLVKALVPIDPLDSSNVLLEVMAGRTTGGKYSKTLYS